jgi:hypothetical protein
MSIGRGSLVLVGGLFAAMLVQQRGVIRRYLRIERM